MEYARARELNGGARVGATERRASWMKYARARDLNWNAWLELMPNAMAILQAIAHRSAHSMSSALPCHITMYHASRIAHANDLGPI